MINLVKSFWKVWTSPLNGKEIITRRKELQKIRKEILPTHIVGYMRKRGKLAIS